MKPGGALKKLFGKPGGARLPWTPPVVTPLHSTYKKYFILILDFGYLRPGQFCGILINRQWEKNLLPPVCIRSSYFTLDELYKTIVDDPGAEFWSVTFIEVIWDHLRAPTGFC